MALVSCTKEITTNNEGEKGINADGTRTLTVSLATNPTKTTLSADGITPVWKEGDKISLNGTEYSVPSDAIGKTEFTLTTTETGAITAVYPADAYQSTDPYFKVSDKQDGSFGCANICVAQAAAGTNTLTFVNVTAVFEVKVPAHTAHLFVTSLGEIDETTGLRGETIRPINTEGANVAAKQKITVNVTDSNDPTTCYVSVLVDETNPVRLTNLNFDAVANETDGTQGGFSPKYLKNVKNVAKPYDLEVEAGTIYSLPGEALHPYVNVNGNKWATCNIGATKPSEPGYYFQFADTTGYTAADKDKTFMYDMSGGQVPGMVFPMSIFHLYGAPYTDALAGSTKYFTEGAKLELKDDAASYWWGGAWRIPYFSDFEDTWDSPDGFTVATDEDGKYTSKNGVFFYWHEYIVGGDDPMNPSGKFVHNEGYLFRLAETNNASAEKKAYVINVGYGGTTGYVKGTEIRAAGIPVRPFSK